MNTEAQRPQRRTERRAPARRGCRAALRAAEGGPDRTRKPPVDHVWLASAIRAALHGPAEGRPRQPRHHAALRCWKRRPHIANGDAALCASLCALCLCVGISSLSISARSSTESRPCRHVGLELPHGQGHVERHLLSPAGVEEKEGRLRRPGVLRGALRHRRGQLELLRRARGRRRRRDGSSRTPADFEFSLKLYQKFTHPEMFLKATRQGSGRSRSKGRGRIPRGDRSAGARREARGAPGAVSGQLQERAGVPRLPASGCSRPSRTIPSPWSCGTAASATTPARPLQLLGEHGAALVQIDEPKFRFSIRQDRLANVKTLLLHAAARQERRAVVEARKVRGPLQLPLLGVGAGAVRRSGRRGVTRREEDLPVREQSLLREVGRQRRDASRPSSGRRSTAPIRRRSSSAIPT